MKKYISSYGGVGLASFAVLLLGLAFQNCSQTLPQMDPSTGSTSSSSSSSSGGQDGSLFYGNPGPSPSPGAGPATGPVTAPSPVAGALVLVPDVPVYRARNSTADYLTTISMNEAKTADGFTYEGQQYKIFSANTGSRVTLYRCYDKTVRHFISSDPNCEARGIEGGVGFSEPSATTGAPYKLVRCYNKGANAHLTTVNPGAECTTATGFVAEDQAYLGFVGI